MVQGVFTGLWSKWPIGTDRLDRSDLLGVANRSGLSNGIAYYIVGLQCEKGVVPRIRAGDGLSTVQVGHSWGALESSPFLTAVWVSEWVRVREWAAAVWMWEVCESRWKFGKIRISVIRAWARAVIERWAVSREQGNHRRRCTIDRTVGMRRKSGSEALLTVSGSLSLD